MSGAKRQGAAGSGRKIAAEIAARRPLSADCNLVERAETKHEYVTRFPGRSAGETSASKVLRDVADILGTDA